MEWFPVTDSILMTSTGLARSTIQTMRNKLKQLGLIDVRVGGHKKPTCYHLVPLYDRDNDLYNDLYNDRLSATKQVTKSVTKQVTKQVAKQGTYKDIDIDRNKKDIYGGGCARESKPSQEEELTKKDEPVFHPGPRSTDEQTVAEVMQVYQNNIHPLASVIERDDLLDLLDHYGKAWMIAAVRVAVDNNARNLGYIKGILKTWAEKGFKAKKERAKSGGYTRRTGTYQSAIELAEDWKNATGEGWDFG